MREFVNSLFSPALAGRLFSGKRGEHYDDNGGRCVEEDECGVW